MGDIETTTTAAARRRLTAAADGMSRWHGALRLLAAVPVTYAAGLVWFVSALSAGQAITGCGFVNCVDPQPALGASLLLPTGASLVAMVAVLTWAMSPERARAVSLGTYALTVAAAAAVFGVMLGFDTAGGTVRNVVAGSSLAALAVIVAMRRRLAVVPRALLHAIEDMPRNVRIALAGMVTLADLLWVVVVAAVGSCDFAGGRCPDPSPEPLLDREGVWLAGGWTLAAGVAVLLLTERRGDPVAWLAAAGAVVVAGLIGA